MTGRTVKIISLSLLAFMVILALTAYGIMKTYDYDKLKAKISDAVMETTGKKLDIAGDIKIQGGFKPSLKLHDVRLRNAKWGTRRQLLTVKEIEIKLRWFPLLVGRVRPESIRFVGPDVLLERGKDGRLNLAPAAFDEDRKTISESAVSGVFPEKLIIERGILTVKGGETGSTRRIRIKRLSVSGKSNGPKFKMEARGTFENKPFEMRGTFGGLRALGNPETPWPADFHMKAENTEFKAAGTVKKPLALEQMNFEARLWGKDPETLHGLLGFRLPLEGPYEVSARLSDPSFHVYRLENLKIASDGNHAKGGLTFDYSGDIPNLSVKLDATKADLRPLLSPVIPAPAENRSKSAEVFSNARIAFHDLDGINGDFSFSADTLKLPGWTMEKVQVEAGLKSGRLQIDQMEGKVAEGEISAVADIKTEDGGAAVKTEINASDLALSKAVSRSDGSDRLRGDVNVHLSVSGTGESVASIMGTLDGGAEIHMKKGRIPDDYVEGLNDFIGGFSAGFFRLLNPLEETSEETVVTCFVCRFDVKNGIVKSRVMVFNTPHMVVVGNGEVNLATESIDFTFKPSPKEGIGIDGVAKINLSLNELKRPFKLGGTLADPEMVIDPAESALMIGKALGGVALFGPAGLAAVLLTGDLAGEENPCLSAIERLKISREKEAAKAEASDRAPEGRKEEEDEAPVTVKDYFE